MATECFVKLGRYIGLGDWLPGLEFDVPSLSLRLLAEAVDFLILCCFKVSITLAVLYRSGIKDPANFAIHLMIEDIGDETTMEDLQRMLLIALVYRLFVCFYETVCIWGVGGATPGKFVLGLRVLSCDSCVSVQADRVLLQRPTNVGFIASATRAMIKNVSIAAFLPALTTIFFNQHKRATYDMAANTVVVKRNDGP